MIIHGDPLILFTLTDAEKALIGEGRPFVRGSKVYAVCHGCSKLIRANKPVVGSLHVCSKQEGEDEDGS